MIKKDNKVVSDITKLSDNSHTLTNHRYKMGIISDRHCGASYGASNLAKSLQNLSNNNCEFIIESGDMTLSGTEAEWQTYVSTIESSPFSRADIHECIGNHENYAGIDTAKARFKTYSNNGELASADEIYFVKDIKGDRFIFTHLQTTSYTTADIFTTAQLDFIENAINTYTGTGFIWILSHQHFQLKGSGDWPETGYYGGGINTTNTSLTNNLRFLNLLNSHQNVIHVHGHSHFSLRYYNTDLGIALLNNKPPRLCAFSRPGNAGNYKRRAGCLGIHCPSGTRLRYANSDTTTPSVEHLLDGVSESIVADVYENGIRLTGLNDGTGATICVHEILFSGDKDVAKIYEIVDGQRVEIFTW